MRDLGATSKVVLKTLRELGKPATPQQIAAAANLIPEHTSGVLRNSLLGLRVERRKSSLKGHPHLYWFIGEQWPLDAPVFSGIRKRDMDAEMRRSRRRGALIGTDIGVAEKRRRRLQRERFPDARFASGAYDKNPLTDTEKAKLWAWANR